MPKVSNPLTIIAIFAGLAEVAMTVTVGLLDGWNQTIFMWFTAAFPIGIAIGFFAVLIRKPALLYAPSDWQDESNAFRSYHNETKLVTDVQELVLTMSDRLNQSTETISPEEISQLRKDADEALVQLAELKKRTPLPMNELQEKILEVFHQNPEQKSTMRINQQLQQNGHYVSLPILNRELNRMRVTRLLGGIANEENPIFWVNS
ncbi:hypothetical protein HOV93_25610 [Planctomycetes bacterium FF15]|uniref:Uncharacterized protein n=2 Tax=Bremerella alba TaxID=980252 RepID=A0A7V9A7G4_9BACT|nr:hypothetical protein [Bremerella alba]